MGKRYYCDYCDRTFADSPVNRKKHVNGVQHQRIRKLHYDSFKDPAQLLAEENQKLPCKRFFQTGNCDFGASCRYSHTNKLLLESQVATSAQLNNTVPNTPKPDINIWLARWEKKRKQRQDKKKSKTDSEDDVNTETFILPPNLPPLSELPPSLLPPPPGGHPKLPEIVWG